MRGIPARFRGSSQNALTSIACELVSMAVADGAGAVGDPLLATLVIGAVIVALLLAVLSGFAYFRRRTTAYFLVGTAFLLFFGQTLSGIASLVGLIDPRFERVLIYGLNVGIGVSILLAVVFARRANKRSMFAFEDE